MTHEEQEDVGSNGEVPMEQGDEQSKDRTEKQQSHDMSVFSCGPVECVLTGVSVDLLGCESE